MNDKLRPCPFCGSDKLTIKNYETQVYVECCACQALGPDGRDETDAIEFWNSRKPDALMYVYSASLADIFGFEKLDEIRKPEADNDER